MLAPLSHGRMHVILRGFEYGSQGVTARIRVVSSDLHTPFTIAYALLILGMLLWLLLATPRINSRIPEDK